MWLLLKLSRGTRALGVLVMALNPFLAMVFLIMSSQLPLTIAWRLPVIIANNFSFTLGEKTLCDSCLLPHRGVSWPEGTVCGPKAVGSGNNEKKAPTVLSLQTPKLRQTCTKLKSWGKNTRLGVL